MKNKSLDVKADALWNSLHVTIISFPYCFSLMHDAPIRLRVENQMGFKKDQLY